MANNIIIEGARIGFRNFSGKEGKYNPVGRRNFCVFLDDKNLVQQLVDDGWNIRFLNPRDEGDDPQACLQVSVRFDNIPPKIVLVTSSGKTMLDEDSVDILDWAEIQNVDVIIHPSSWNVNGKAGIKAYLKTMYATIAEDEFESKYRDVPDSAQSAMVGGFESD